MIRKFVFALVTLAIVAGLILGWSTFNRHENRDEQNARNAAQWQQVQYPLWQKRVLGAYESQTGTVESMTPVTNASGVVTSINFLVVGSNGNTLSTSASVDCTPQSQYGVGSLVTYYSFDKLPGFSSGFRKTAECLKLNAPTYDSEDSNSQTYVAGALDNPPNIPSQSSAVGSATNLYGFPHYDKILGYYYNHSWTFVLMVMLSFLGALVAFGVFCWAFGGNNWG